MKIIDDFLSPFSWVPMSAALRSATFPWYYDEEFGKFIHLFYKNKQPTSKVGSIVNPIIKELNVKEVSKVEANLVPKTSFRRTAEFILTSDGSLNGSKSAIYYLNTNNVYTKFDTGEKVKCIANRMVIFDSTIKHVGFSCTNEKQKILIKFNYEG